MSAQEIPSAVDWAREHGAHLRWTCALDNHEPTRDYAYGDLYAYSLDDVRGSGIVLEPGSLRDAHRAIYLVDDGLSVRPFYVAGWRLEDPSAYVLLHAFPVNVNDDGSLRVRTNDGRPVDFSSWMLGPRRTYHLKARAL